MSLGDFVEEEHAIATATIHRRAFNKIAIQKKHHNRTDAERESSESKTEQKLRSAHEKTTHKM